MNCKETEYLYLYPDLSAAEQQRVDEHVLHCAACRELLPHIQASASAIRTLAGTAPAPENAARLTATIMQAVVAQQKKSTWIYLPWIRFSLAACSLALIVLFTVQQQEVLHMPQQHVNGDKILLNTSSALHSLQQYRKRKIPTSSIYVCARQGTCDVPLYYNLKQNK